MWNRQGSCLFCAPLLNLESVSYLFDDLQIVSDMKKDNLSNENAHSYAPPVCEEFYVGLEIVICASETENVGETEGEW